MTSEQLHASLGQGVQAGWDPIDGGNARLWVPNTWTFSSEGACDGSGTFFVALSATHTAVNTDQGYWPVTPRAHCPAMRSSDVSTQAVAFIALARKHAAQPAVTVHGYRLYLTKRPTRREPWSGYDIPQLGVQITTHGSLSRRILGTLAPSPRFVALDSAYETTPAGSHAIAEDGVRLSIPQAWRLATAKQGDSDFGSHKPAELTIVKPFQPAPAGNVTGVIGCQGCGVGPQEPLPPAMRGLVPDSGGSLYMKAGNDDYNQWYDSATPGLATRRGQPITTLHHGATTITIWVEPYASDTLALFFQRDTSTATHELVLGLGSDGRVAAGVIASIRATT